ncbi:AAA family ATPase [Haloferax sp. ATB1]|uniref:AAA family ATPase n=1 Tax=Haloferax sp. ATB1 TaxID=1508454 RepID=UPI000A411B00|nr:AAA family ATPase [Haloferax sp. ATB1]
MKISRLEIENFAIDESPTITQQSVSGRDLLLYGGNRSGKTLTFNAILYGLYGRSGTFGISPGQRSKVNLHFDNSDAVLRERSHRFEHDGDLFDATEGVERFVGPEESVRLQFITSSPPNQPISTLNGDELLDRIRGILSSGNQSEIERHRRAKADLKHLEEIRRRGEDSPSVGQLKRDLQSLPISRTENRIENIIELQRLIDSGEIKIISARLQKKDEVAERLSELYDERRTIEHSLKKKREELSDASRYTQEVNDLLIDAIEEFTCPVCGRLVEESIARSRLPSNCPQCGRPRDLSELRNRLREKVDNADTTIQKIKQDIADLEEQLASVKAEITELQEADPELEGLNQFVRTALKQAEHDMEQLQVRTSNELKNHQEELSEFKSAKEGLEGQLESRQELLASIDESIEQAEQAIDRLEQEAFEEIRDDFTDRLSTIYKSIAPDLGTNVSLSPEGELEFPGTGSEGSRSYNRLSSGERRLVNLGFWTHTS